MAHSYGYCDVNMTEAFVELLEGKRLLVYKKIRNWNGVWSSLTEVAKSLLEYSGIKLDVSNLVSEVRKVEDTSWYERYQLKFEYGGKEYALEIWIEKNNS